MPQNAARFLIKYWSTKFVFIGVGSMVSVNLCVCENERKNLNWEKIFKFVHTFLYDFMSAKILRRFEHVKKILTSYI